jgi:hypothetical protein
MYSKNSQLSSIQKQIDLCNKNKKIIEEKIAELIKTPEKVKRLSAKIQLIESAYRLKKISHMLQFHSEYYSTKQTLQELKKVSSQQHLLQLQQQLSKEKQRSESLKSNLFQKMEWLKQQLILKQIERSSNEKNRKKRKLNNTGINRADCPIRISSRIERFKNSTGGSSNAITTRSSIWTVRKR